jgi:hypothetical protein
METRDSVLCILQSAEVFLALIILIPKSDLILARSQWLVFSSVLFSTRVVFLVTSAELSIAEGELVLTSPGQ